MSKEKNNRKLSKQSFMQGVLALMLSQVVIKLLGLVYKLYLTNREGFGDAGNAIYSSGFQIYALLLTLSSVGVPGAISKLISERVSIGDNKGAHRILKIAFATFACIGLIGTLFLFFGAHYISNEWLQIPEAELTLVTLSPAIFFVAISAVMRGYFNGRQDLKATANSQTVEQLFKTIITVIAVELIATMSSGNTVLMAAGANLATTLSTCLSFIYIYMYYKNRKKEIAQEVVSSTNTKKESIKTVIKNILFVSIPMSLSSIMASLNKTVDSVTVVRSLKTFMSAEAAKIQYGMLSGKVDTLTTLPLSFNIAFATALVPAIAAAKAKGDMKTGSKRVSFSLLITMLLGLPCTVGLIIFAQPILNLLFPNANEGALILQVSSIMIIFMVLEQTVNGALQGLGKIMIPTISLLFGVSAKIILNLILVKIPSIGVVGAAIGTVVCHIISFAIGFSILTKHMKLNLKFSNFVLKPILATLIMSVCSYYIYILLNGPLAEKLATTISLISAVLIYVISVIVLKIFTKEDMNMIPYGQKVYKVLVKMGIYKDEESIEK